MAENGRHLRAATRLPVRPASWPDAAEGRQSMSLLDCWRTVRLRWVTVIVAAALGLAAAAAVFFVRPPEYTANLTVYVSARAAETTQMAYQGGLLSQQRVTSYVELVNSERVRGEVIRRLQLSETSEELADRITASTTLDSVLIDIAVTDPSPDAAAATANVTAVALTELINELERPTGPGETPAVVVRLVQPAIPPVEPSSPGLALLLPLGFVSGLLVGVGLAVARSALDRSVRRSEDLSLITNTPNLATIAFDATVPKKPLTVHENPHSPRSETFRHLRTNLQFIDVDNPTRVLVVTSSLPGEGKTTTVCNLAIAMAYAGSRVLVVEADLRRPGLADLFGLERAVGLTSILAGTVSVEHAIQSWSGGVLDVLASGPLPPNPSELLASNLMKELLTKLAISYDVILIDTPPLLPVTDAAAVAPAADGVILVCRFRKTGRDQVRSAVAALDAVGAPLLGTILSMTPASGPDAYGRYSTYYRYDQDPRYTRMEPTSTAADAPTVSAKTDPPPEARNVNHV